MSIPLAKRPGNVHPLSETPRGCASATIPLAKRPGDARETTSRVTMSLGRGKERDKEVGRESCHKGIRVILLKGPTFNFQIVAIQNSKSALLWGIEPGTL